MGWWDESIMGGDGPLDVKSFFQDQFGTRNHPDDDIEMTYPESESVIVKFISDRINGNGFYDHEVYGPVAFMMMELGWPISDSLKQDVLKAVQGEDLCRWRNPDRRKQCLDQFAKMLIEYNGTPTEMPLQPGLFDKIFGEE